MKPMLAPVYADQILASYAPRDAIGSQVETMQRWLTEKGLNSQIFADQIVDYNEKPAHHVRHYSPRAISTAVSLFHFAVGSDIPYMLGGWKSFRICFYHNITPPDFFDRDHESDSYYACLKGYYQLPTVCRHSELGWTVSTFNATQMKNAGFRDVIVTPIYKDYEALARRTSPGPRSVGGRKSLLFVGRIFPNKGHHDLVNMLVRYRDLHKSIPRLVFAGSPHHGYMARVVAQAKAAGLVVSESRTVDAMLDADIIFLGALSDQKLSEVYRNSDAFICFSDHEGFCVPIVEAMSFGLPVIAHNSSAVPETCNGGAVIINKANLDESVGIVHKVLTDGTFAAELSERSNRAFEKYRSTQMTKTYDEAWNRVLAAYATWSSTLRT